MWNIFKQYETFKLRKHYKQLRVDALEAKRSGDRIRYVVLNATADKMIDRVLYS